MPVTRFAPSPTGLLHRGHAFSALFARTAAGPGGTLRLRIEDIDLARCRPQFTIAIEEDLTWLGLDWPRPVRHQSAHLGKYRAALAHLHGMGLLYPCFCTRARLAAEMSAPHGATLPYPGFCRAVDSAQAQDRIAAGEPHAWRLDVAAALLQAGRLCWLDTRLGEIALQPEILGDVVLARKEFPASYHLAVTLDDALEEIEIVTRGEDLLQATHIHRLLQALLELPVPIWHHHPLIVDAAGQRLAKRHGAPTLRALRESGTPPETLRRELGFR